MSEQYWNPLNENTEPENKAPEYPETSEKEAISTQDQPTDTGYQSESVSAPQEDNNIFSSSVQAQSSYSDYQPVSEPAPQPEQPVYTNPYTAPQQTHTPSYTERPASNSATEKSYNDGYYHQSFTRGSAVNYTAPASQPAQTYSAPQAKPERKKKERKSLTRGGAAFVLILCLLISGAAGFGGSMLAQSMNQQKYQTTDADTMVIHKVDTEIQTAGTEALVDKTTSEIASEVADSVVEITTEVMQTSSFYGQYIAKGAGSGVIISEDGYILTNNHVIDGATSINVTTRSGESYDATLVGTDSEVDIALLKINATGLKSAVFGDSDTLGVGDKAVIIGNPLGTLGGSVTEGIISALDRSIVIDGKTMNLMQTDAAINPGNSGGGMFNGQGELAGIVVAKSSSSSESIDNIGFVIPINNVLDILANLKEYGYVRGRADTGMSFIDLSNQMYAWYYYGNNSAGVYVSEVESGSNAEQAGFRAGDRIISIDGREISSSDELLGIISGKSAGDTVTLEVDREGSRGSLQLTLQEKVPNKTTSQSSDTTQNSNPFSRFGR